jgi:hypothetical protein
MNSPVNSKSNSTPAPFTTLEDEVEDTKHDEQSDQKDDADDDADDFEHGRTSSLGKEGSSCDGYQQDAKFAVEVPQVAAA